MHTVASHPLLTRARSACGSETEIVATRWGYPLAVPTWDAGVSAHLRRDGLYEERLVQHFKELIIAGDHVWIAGSNIGVYDCAALTAQPCVYVYSFEPHESLLPYLLFNKHMRMDDIGWNGSDGITAGGTFQYALADVACQACLWEPGSGDRPGNSSLTVQESWGHDTVKKWNCTCTTIDMQMIGERRCDVLKIDVEGSEALVIEGAKKLLSDENRRPRSIVIEYEKKHASNTDHFRRLAEYGYKFTVLASTPNELPWERVTPDELEGDAYTFAEVHAWL